MGLRTLAQQAFAGHVPYVSESLQDTTSQPYLYLVMDLHPQTARYPTITQQHTALTTILPCSLRQQENT